MNNTPPTKLKPTRYSPSFRAGRSLNACLLLSIMGAAFASSGWAQRGASGPPILPDPRMTPGDVLAVTKSDICVSGYSSKVRDVPQAVKQQAYQNYGITHHNPGEFEVDHLISLELGGSNSLKNLWPESYLTSPWNAHVKDKLENELHRLVCNGQLDLVTAQHDIATDWIAAYKKYFHTTTPLSKRGRAGGGIAQSGGGTGAGKPSLKDRIKNKLFGRSAKVWVNLSSGKYFYPGTRYYGNTKKGVYLSEAQAKQQGYTAAQEK